MKLIKYELHGGNILKDGHTMFLKDVVSDLNRKAFLEFNIEIDKQQPVKPLPEFLGVICKACESPFLIWRTEFEGINPDDPDFNSYMEDGLSVKVIGRAVVGDINKWCKCKDGE